MTVQDAEDSTHMFDPGVRSVQDLVTCPNCCQASPLLKWERGEFISCDFCGEHMAVRCPICQMNFDEPCDHQTFHVTVAGELLL